MSWRIAWVGAAAVLCGSACANIWGFGDLQRGTGGDNAGDATAESSTIADSSVPDGEHDAGASDSRPGASDALGERGPSDGACPDACATGTACDNGACICQSQPNQCGSQCVDLLNNHDHCGTCATVCPGGATCSAGACNCPAAEPSTCTKIGSDAGPTCVDILTDHSHCGGCNNACTATSACHRGTCTVCGSVPTDRQCDGGVCVDTASDPLNCGACNQRCPTSASCVNATCPCPTGLKLCGANPGACIDVTNGDPSNCGACGHVCGLAHAAASCSVSACIIFKCNAGYTDCDLVPSNGCEVHTVSDPSNCGSCGHACKLAHAVPHCGGNTCVVNACDPGYLNCDGLDPNGCEVHTDTDVNNCGACGHVCPVPTGGSAACVAGVCGGNCSMAGSTACPVVNPTTCVSLSSDPNCGSCGYNCNLMTGGTCVTGVCVVPLIDAGSDAGPD